MFNFYLGEQWGEAVARDFADKYEYRNECVWTHIRDPIELRRKQKEAVLCITNLTSSDSTSTQYQAHVTLSASNDPLPGGCKVVAADDSE